MFFFCFRALSTQQGGYVGATNLYYYYYYCRLFLRTTNIIHAAQHHSTSSPFTHLLHQQDAT